MAPLRRAVERLRRPEYVGENRCLPCTAVNLAVAVVLAVAVAAVLARPGTPAVGLLGGALALALSAVAIYLRGYLVPGTPWLTRTYFPDWVLRRFDKAHAVPEEGGNGEVDPEAVLREAGAVTECEREDDLCLTDGFRDAWRRRVRELRGTDASRAELAAVLGVEAAHLTFDEHGDGFVAWFYSRRVGQWESRAAFLADVAAARELRERGGVWADLSLQGRSTVLNGLRVFLERCPACDGSLAIGQETVDSCCRSMEVAAVTCRDCGARVFEAEV